MITRSSYTKQLEQLDGHVKAISQAVVEDVRATGRALAEEDEAAASEVIDGHDAAIRLERSVEDSCMGLMLLQQPLARDLRLVTAAFRAITDLSRIEQMAYETALLAREMDIHKAHPLANDLLLMSNRAAAMVEAAMDSFETGDVAKAEDVFPMDDSLDDLYERVRKEVVDVLKSDSDAASEAPEVLTIAKYYERMGDHAQSLADWAIFRATGTYRGHAMGDKE